MAEKYSKSEVGFEHPAKGKQHCAGCKHFEVLAPYHCEIVSGRIMPGDWCKKYESKTQEKQMSAVKGYNHPGNAAAIRPHASHPGTQNGRYSHGMCGTPEYRAYTNAYQRCNNPRNTRYADWGGRGIRFLFVSFTEFFKEIGPKPSPRHILDRINNDGHYQRGNIRWATASESAINKKQSLRDRDTRTGRFLGGCHAW